MLRERIGVPRRTRRLILDTGPMVVLGVGSLNSNLLGRTKRTHEYSPTDYEVLLHLLAEFAFPPLTTRSVLAETSNMLQQALGDEAAFAVGFVTAWQSAVECDVSCESAVAEALFPTFGLADSTLRVLASDEQIILTADFDLYVRTAPLAVNFDHLRF